MARGLLNIPDVGWLDAGCLELLRKIPGPHIAKKRATVILLATALASETALARVFEDTRACNQRVWYQKWKNVASIAAALDACTVAALDARDQETARVEGRVLQERRRAIAAGSLDAIAGLRMTALEVRDADGTQASRVLLKLADPNLPGLEDGASALSVEISNLDELIEYELARVAGSGEDVAVESVA